MISAPVPESFARLAPGTALRDGLDRIVRGHTGALIVLGTNEQLQAISSGGFVIDVAFTATGLRELAKMDGAIVLSDDLSRILAAAVHLTPDTTLPTGETGTRHRTAERVARQVGVPVVTVSASMSAISLFDGDERRPVPRPEELMDRAAQALSAIGGHRQRLDASLNALTALEVGDTVTVRDLAHVAQRFEMTHRLADEASGYVAALGVDGRLVSLQLRDLVDDLMPLSSLLQRDYVAEGAEGMPFDGLGQLDDQELFDIVLVGRALSLPPGVHLDSPLRPRGYRQLAAIPRLPAGVSARVVERFGDLPGVLGATPAELAEVEGMTRAWARLLRDGLSDLADRSL